MKIFLIYVFCNVILIFSREEIFDFLFVSLTHRGEGKRKRVIIAGYSMWLMIFIAYSVFAIPFFLIFHFLRFSNKKFERRYFSEK